MAVVGRVLSLFTLAILLLAFFTPLVILHIKPLNLSVEISFENLLLDTLEVQSEVGNATIPNFEETISEFIDMEAYIATTLLAIGTFTYIIAIITSLMGILSRKMALATAIVGVISWATLSSGIEILSDKTESTLVFALEGGLTLTLILAASIVALAGYIAYRVEDRRRS